MKEDFFSKFKDYNKELEKILEHKDFSQDAKNLLLSMFYKLEASYEDYVTVKRHCKTKQEYLEKILSNIKTINLIQLEEPGTYNFETVKENGLCLVDLSLKRIIVLANEFALLKALLELNNFQIHLKDEYNIIKKCMPYLLNMAYDMENIEVIRDFNAWSWNSLVEEIKDIRVNLIYQNLRIALNADIFARIEETNIDAIKIMEQNLLRLYNKEIAEKVMELIFKISIIIYIQANPTERKRLIEEKQRLEKYWNKINDKKAYVEEVCEEKRKLTEELKRIELILKSKELLMQEYESRNKQVAAYNKILNISHLVEVLQSEKKQILVKIETCNKRIDPKNYLEDRAKFEKDYLLLKDINFEGNNEIYKYINQVQAIFVKHILVEKIKRAATRSEMIDCMYELRYYKFLPYTKDKRVKDIEYLEAYIEQAEELLIKKMYDNKLINTISTNLENDIDIVKSIFDLKIINMEQIYIQMHKQKSDIEYALKIYDGKETLEREQMINLEFNKKDKIKLNKKIKLII